MLHNDQLITLKAGQLPSKHRRRRAVMPAPATPPAPNGDLALRLVKIIQYCQFALTQPPAMQMTALLAISAVTDGALKKGQPSHVG